MYSKIHSLYGDPNPNQVWEKKWDRMLAFVIEKIR
jgi:hypothetical protein